MSELESESFQPVLRLLNLFPSRHCNSDPGGEKTEMQKVADPADISVLFFQLVLIFGPFWVIFGPFWVIFGPIWAILGHFWVNLGNFG